MFVEATAVDALAVGSTSAIRQRNAMLDLELITRLRFGPGAAWSLCGSSGVDDEQLLGAVRHGLTKISIGTLLKARVPVRRCRRPPVPAAKPDISRLT